MNLENIEKTNVKLSLYLRKHRTTKIELSDTLKCIEIQEAKDYIESFLLTPKWWYEDREQYLKNLLIWIEKRIQTAIKNMNDE